MNNIDYHQSIKNYQSIGSRLAANYILKILLLESLFKIGVDTVYNKVYITASGHNEVNYEDGGDIDYMPHEDHSHSGIIYEMANIVTTNITSMPVKKIIVTLKEINANAFHDIRYIQLKDSEYVGSEHEFLSNQFTLFLMQKTISKKSRFNLYFSGAKHFISEEHLPFVEQFIKSIEKQQTFYFPKLNIFDQQINILPDNIRTETLSYYLFGENLYDAKCHMVHNHNALFLNFFDDIFLSILNHSYIHCSLFFSFLHEKKELQCLVKDTIQSKTTIFKTSFDLLFYDEFLLDLFGKPDNINFLNREYTIDMHNDIVLKKDILPLFSDMIINTLCSPESSCKEETLINQTNKIVTLYQKNKLSKNLSATLSNSDYRRI